MTLRLSGFSLHDVINLSSEDLEDENHSKAAVGGRNSNEFNGSWRNNDLKAPSLGNFSETKTPKFGSKLIKSNNKYILVDENSDDEKNNDIRGANLNGRLDFEQKKEASGNHKNEDFKGISALSNGHTTDQSDSEHESDDEIEELDPEMVNIEKFKPTSFHKHYEPKYRDRTQPLSGGILKPFPNIRRHSDRLESPEVVAYNPVNPADPQLDYTPESVLAERKREREARLNLSTEERNNLEFEQMKYNKESQRAIERKSKLLLERNRVKNRLQHIHAEGFNEERSKLQNRLMQLATEIFDTDQFINRCNIMLNLITTRLKAITLTISRLQDGSAASDTYFNRLPANTLFGIPIQSLDTLNTDYNTLNSLHTNREWNNSDGVHGFETDPVDLERMKRIIINRGQPHSENQTAKQDYSSDYSSNYEDYDDVQILSKVEADDFNAARRNREGFTANIYSTEDHDLKQLLTSIVPDEEVEEDSLATTPKDMNIQLLKHQRMGLTWMMQMEDLNMKGGLLADDMGLGKTIQAIALIISRKPDAEKPSPTLVIAPVSLLHQWKGEMEQRIKQEASLKIAIYHSVLKAKLKKWKDLTKFDVVLTSYGTLSLEFKNHYKEALAKTGASPIPSPGSGGISYNSPFYDEEATFHRVILDESQNIKNKTTITSRSVFLLKSVFRFCLSGTPMQNSLDELYPTIRFLRIKPYNDEVRFKSDISLSLKSKNGKYDKYDKTKLIQKVRALLKAVMLRRTKDLEIDNQKILTLPPKEVIEESCRMEGDEKSYYETLERGIKFKAKIMLDKNVVQYSSILTLLLRLRQACCHRYLVAIGDMNKNENEEETKYNERDYVRKFDIISSLDPKIVAQILQTTGYIKKYKPGNNFRSKKVSDAIGKQETNTIKFDIEKDFIVEIDLDDSDDGLIKIKPEDLEKEISNLSEKKSEEQKMLTFDQIKAELKESLKSEKTDGHEFQGLKLEPDTENPVSEIKAKVENQSHSQQLVKSEFVKSEDSPNIKEKYLASIEESYDEFFTCPICFDALSFNRTVIFPSCGHMICKYCVENFIENYGTGDDFGPGKRLAKCMTCKVRVKEHEIIEFLLFHQIYIRKWSLNAVLSHFERLYAKPKLSLAEKIAVLIKDDVNGFVPSAKMEQCMQLVQKILAQKNGEKIIIFSQFLAMFELLKILFKKAGIRFLQYDGSMSIEEKNATVKKFYQDPQISVLFLSLRAGNVGLTLTCANHVIIMDPFWNPYVEEQAMDRSHRIGQQREVKVHKLLIYDTVEKRILDLQNQKKELVGAAMHEGEIKNVSKLGRRELGYLFGLNDLN